MTVSVRDALLAEKRAAMKARAVATTPETKSFVEGRLNAINLVLADLVTEDKRTEDGVPLSDAAVRVLLTGMVKKFTKSAEVYAKAGQVERAAREQADADIIAEFVPSTTLDEAATRALVAEVIASGATSMRDVMAVIGKRDDVDKRLASGIVKGLLG